MIRTLFLKPNWDITEITNRLHIFNRVNIFSKKVVTQLSKAKYYLHTKTVKAAPKLTQLARKRENRNRIIALERSVITYLYCFESRPGNMG